MVTVFPFVGRTQEQAALLAHIQAATTGSGGLLLVGGEAGAGKTTLLRTVMAAHPSVNVTGRCPGPDETPPFGPWAEAVQRLNRELGWETAHLPQPFGESSSRMSAYELAGALAHWLGQSGQPLMLAVEDLHWADEASLTLLRHMPSWLADWPVLVIGTYRTDELSRQHPLWHLLPEVQRAGANRILLERLTRSEVAELLAQTLPPELNDETVAGQVHERTAGLALFVRELIDPVVRTGRLPGPKSPLPQTLQQAIDSKLDRLPPQALAVLEPAAVIGERFSVDLLAEVTETAEDALSEALEAAIARHVIRPQDTTGGWFTFDHALYRESLLIRQIGAKRRKWHAHIAAALLAAPEADLDAAAYHLARAGDPRAIEYLLAAGDRARALGALAQARDRYEQALSQLPPSHPSRPELLLKLAWCLRWDDPARAAATCEEALSTATAAGDQEVALWVRHLMLDLARNSNDARFLEQAADVIAAEEAMLDNPRYQRLESDLFGGPAGYPRAATSLILVLTLGGLQDQARAYLQEIAPRALPSAGPDILYSTMKLALVDGRLAEAAEQCSHAAGVALRHRAYREALQLRVGEMMIRLVGPADRSGDLDRVAEQLQVLEEEAWRQAGYALVKRGFAMTGMYRYFRGDWEAAYHHVVEAARQDPRAYDGELAWYAGRILLKVGAPEEALPFAEAVPPFRPTDPVSIGGGLMVLPHTLRAEIHVEQGNLGQARVWLEAAERWPALSTAPYYRASVRKSWAEYFRAAGDPDRAWQSATEALDASRKADSAFVAIEAHRLMGELAAERGEIETAMEHFRASLALAERCRFPIEKALTRLARGRALAGRPEAERDLQEVRAFFSKVGCTPGLAMARRALELAAPRVNPRPETASSSLPDGLTAREGEVVTLVCRGMTDREIGACLFISVKTVDRHLRNIFNKTGVNKRAALATYAARHGLLP